jgi:triacylglycerol lipase
MLPLPLLLPAAAVVAGSWWLWRCAPWRGARTRWPILLAHGVMGFTELSLGRIRQSYFRGIPEKLGEHGIEVHRPSVPAIGSIAKRAEALAAFVRALPTKKVNIVAHSMGGLDARYAIKHLGLAPRVASLTTIGTPHRGSPIADVGAALVGNILGLNKLLGLVGLGVDAFHDLTTEHMTKFNAEVEDARGVRYFSVIATVDHGDPDLLPLLSPSSLFLTKRTGPSDGMVPADSQAWGRVLDRVKADHWAQIGWSRSFDAAAYYEGLCRKLRARGL